MRKKRFALMDVGQASWPMRSRARVVCNRHHRRDVQKCTRLLFGRPLESWEYAGLSGAPDDAVVQVGIFQTGLVLEFRPPQTDDYFARRLVRRVPDGPVLVDDGLHIFRQAMQGRGLGLRIYLRQVVHAQALGVHSIEATAVRECYENGYYTWPRYGFDAPLPADIVRRLPSVLRSARTVLDLMETQFGRDWWRHYGTTLEVRFELCRDSRSWRVFFSYVAHRLGIEFEDADAHPALPSGHAYSVPCAECAGETLRPIALPY